MSAPSKKPFFKVSCPILVCSAFKSGSGSGFGPSNTCAARSISCFFQSAIWFGWISYRYASSASVAPLFIAASTTCTLNAGEWFRRFLLVMLLLPFKPSARSVVKAMLSQ